MIVIVIIKEERSTTASRLEAECRRHALDQKTVQSLLDLRATVNVRKLQCLSLLQQPAKNVNKRNSVCTGLL